MSDELPKIDAGPPKKKDAGFAGTGISSGVVITIICVLLLRGVRVAMRSNPEREAVRQQELQRQQAIQSLNEEISKTPPEKMGKAMKMLLGIKDEPETTDKGSDAKTTNAAEQSAEAAGPK